MGWPRLGSPLIKYHSCTVPSSDLNLGINRKKYAHSEVTMKGWSPQGKRASPKIDAYFNNIIIWFVMDVGI